MFKGFSKGFKTSRISSEGVQNAQFCSMHIASLLTGNNDGFVVKIDQKQCIVNCKGT
jgi:hypothetical protein